MLHHARRLGALATAVALASCGGGQNAPFSGPAGVSLAPAVKSSGCYVTTVAPKTVTATITFYGWPDNSPPGNAIAHPVIHRVAGGDGTYCNPTTFATERSNDKTIPYGTKIYVPAIGQYFVREDLCAASGPPVGSGSNGCYKLWFDLWIGGTAASNTNAVVNCEDSTTPSGKVPVVVDPGPSEPVAFSGPVYVNNPPPAGTCDGKPGDTSPPLFALLP